MKGTTNAVYSSSTIPLVATKLKSVFMQSIDYVHENNLVKYTFTCNMPIVSIYLFWVGLGSRSGVLVSINKSILIDCVNSEAYYNHQEDPDDNSLTVWKATDFTDKVTVNSDNTSVAIAMPSSLSDTVIEGSCYLNALLLYCDID